eukprot:CAMPEP_0119406026 /NCGR_PEP_ID=MMETSP1335-20130426/517_1 /TAXON_ID=259385 /ORGANISM="Chrysoculter rhomboideus, Strain RCC1486" /LENGTH=232 /DNA_ID=CAMNT_0007430085 /DNA_START=16 /DNA_END=714 /DNA_ORIENTATION=+
MTMMARLALVALAALPLATGLRQPAVPRAGASPACSRAASSKIAVHFRAAAAALLVAGASAMPAMADGDTEKFKFPPIDRSNKNRCRFTSSAMGQANAARDSLYDLRECSLDGQSAEGFDISGALLASGSFKKANFKTAQLSKVYGPEANFDGADFTDAVVDRAFFKGASFKDVLFVNTVLTSTSFEDADLENTDFSGAYLGQFDARKLCKNPTLKGTNPITKEDTKESAGC